MTNPEEKIDYLLDLTKDYHNMLERTVNGETEVYTYDSNVVSMSRAGNDYFYMLDELGTGMYLTGTDGVATSTYAYDEFGRNINPFIGQKEKPAYTKNGNIIQPLAFTGYQHDEMTGSYFAQARYYDSNAGRFVSEDKVRGFVGSPDTINHYLYCWNSPVDKEDLDGNFATIVIGAAIGGVIGGGATVVSSLVKGEDISWKEVGKNALIGSGAGAVIGSGVGLVSAAAGSLGASATVTSGIAIGGGAVSTAMATSEAASQIQNKEDIDMKNISIEGAKGAVTGIVAGASIAFNPLGASQGFMWNLVSDCFQGELSTPESYAGAMFGGSVMLTDFSAYKGGKELAKVLFFNGAKGGFSGTMMADTLEGLNGRKRKNMVDTLMHSTFSGVTTGLFSLLFSFLLPEVTEMYLNYSISSRAYDLMENILEMIYDILYNDSEKNCEEKK